MLGSDYTPVVLNFVAHESLGFSQVTENKALPCLALRRFRSVID